MIAGTAGGLWPRSTDDEALAAVPGTDKPTPIIHAQSGPYVGPFHWENRPLRVPELKALFGFLQEFEMLEPVEHRVEAGGSRRRCAPT